MSNSARQCASNGAKASGWRVFRCAKLRREYAIETVQVTGGRRSAGKPADSYGWGSRRRTAPALTTLKPGGFREITQNLKVNVVFVGYEPGAGSRDINEAA